MLVDLPVAFKQARDVVGLEGDDAAQVDRSAVAFARIALHDRDALVQLFERGIHVSKELSAVLGQLDVAARLLKQGDPELLLERRNRA